MLGARRVKTDAVVRRCGDEFDDGLQGGERVEGRD
jgi:hypothetical protein